MARLNDASKDLLEATLCELIPMKRVFGSKVTPHWLSMIAFDLVVMEVLRVTHFGAGSPRPDIAAWYITQRVLHERVTYIERGGRMVPKVTHPKWDHLQVTSYVAQLKSERLGGHPNGSEK